MKKNSSGLIYKTPSMETIEMILEGSVLAESGTAGGDAGGEGGWDD